MVQLPVTTDAAADNELMSSVAPHETACPTIGREAGEITDALGQVVAIAFDENKRIQVTTASRDNRGSILFIIRTLVKINF